MEAHIADREAKAFLARDRSLVAAALLCSVPLYFFRSTAFPLLPSSRIKDAPRVFLRARACVVMDLHFLALRLASLCLGVFRAGTWSRAFLGFLAHTGSSRFS